MMSMPTRRVTNLTFQIVIVCIFPIPTIGTVVMGTPTILSKMLPMSKQSMTDIAVHPFGTVFPIYGAVTTRVRGIYGVHDMLMPVMGTMFPAFGFSITGNVTHLTGFF